MTTQTVIPFPDDIPLAEVFRSYYTNDVARVLAVEGHPHQEHPPLGGQESILYLLLASRPESLGEQKYALVVTYRLFVDLSGQRELIFRDCLEEEGPFVHACPLSLLGQLSPTSTPVVHQWRLACWNYWFDQARPIQEEVPTSLPVALLSSPVHLVVSFHRVSFFR